MTYPSGMTLRPYQLLCAVCALGAQQGEETDHRISEMLARVRETPDMPVTLHCNVGELFACQDPGTADDTPEGAEFNLRRDLEILHKLNLFPGCTLPARILFNRLLAHIDEVTGICGYDTESSAAWAGCPRAGSDRYARGHARGIEAIIPPRSEEELAREKAESLDAMYRAAGGIGVRPHILLCAICQYGSGIRPPFPEDNLPELLHLILQQPDTAITLVPHADWMICAPCPYRASALNACVNNRGAGGLSNQLRDLRVLQKLGLTFGQTLPARELYGRIFARIGGTLEVCRLDHGDPSVWYTGCGAATTDSAAYAKGKRLLIAALGCGKAPVP